MDSLERERLKAALVARCRMLRLPDPETKAEEMVREWEAKQKEQEHRG